MAFYFSLALGLILLVEWRMVMSDNRICFPEFSKIDCGYSSQHQCEQTGCCYTFGEKPPCYHQSVVPSNPQCLINVTRVPCGLPKITSDGECIIAGCCWNHTGDFPRPYCFFSSPNYVVQSSNQTDHGIKLILRNPVNLLKIYQIAAPISRIELEVTRETESRLHIKITDPNKERYEIPSSVLPVPPPPTKPLSNYYYDYEFAGVGEEFYMIIKRRYTNEIIFNTKSIGFIFADTFLKIGTSLPSNYNIYGLGEHKTSLRLNPGRGYTLWNYDTPTPKNVNLYGSHPFYLEMRDGKAHGVFLRNSNGMDVMLEDTSLTYRVIGGVLDFYFFVGELGQPDEVIHSYQEVIGRPAMPPYWALGFHQCRWGYKNLQAVQDVVGNFTDAKIPLDGVWLDIDYMDGYKDFTTDPTNFPASSMKNFISDLHSNGKHFVVIVDPAISNQASSYKPYKDGMEMDIFIKDDQDKVFVGKVWPGFTVYPDFLHPNASQYWKNQIATFMEQVPVDGIWIDMNEPSNFCNGACTNLKKQTSNASVQAGFDLFYPPYSINSQDQQNPLEYKTLVMTTKQYGGHVFYNTHNLYGFTESIATRKALLSINKGKRPFVLSRSTFPGSGVHAAHWLGDNTASADDMYFSIPGILNFQMFGVPLVGADICGFGGNTTEELCSRWTSVGAFYPFSRNHNIKGGNSQEPYRWSSVAAISRKALSIRYSLLPYYYTLFYKAHHDYTDTSVLLPSAMVIKPLFFDFYKDPDCLSIDKQFLVGSAILISPQLQLGDNGKSLNVYLPPAKWYDWYTHEAVTDKGGINMTISTPLDHIPIHVRGGSIIPMQGPGLTTTESRKNPYSLLVALDIAGGSDAFGDIYLDDGETYNTTEYTYVTYSCQGQQLSAYPSGTGYASKNNIPLLTSMTIVGVVNKPSVVSLNGNPTVFSSAIIGDTIFVTVTGLKVAMDKAFNLDWI